jgi:hypothetical protein
MLNQRIGKIKMHPADREIGELIIALAEEAEEMRTPYAEDAPEDDGCYVYPHLEILRRTVGVDGATIDLIESMCSKIDELKYLVGGT